MSVKNSFFCKKQGQIFSTDAVVSLIAFTIVLIVILATWNLYSLRLNQNVDSEELNLIAFQVSNILTKNHGVPSNWQSSPEDVEVIGLLSSPGKVDENKLNTFLTMGYNLTKQTFNIERFEYSFFVQDVSGQVLNFSGINVSNAEQSVSVNNLVLVNNETRELIFTLWKE